MSDANENEDRFVVLLRQSKTYLKEHDVKKYIELWRDVESNPMLLQTCEVALGNYYLAYGYYLAREFDKAKTIFMMIANSDIDPESNLCVVSASLAKYYLWDIDGKDNSTDSIARAKELSEILESIDIRREDSILHYHAKVCFADVNFHSDNNENVKIACKEILAVNDIFDKVYIYDIIYAVLGLACLYEIKRDFKMKSIELIDEWIKKIPANETNAILNLRQYQGQMLIDNEKIEEAGELLRDIENKLDEVIDDELGEEIKFTVGVQMGRIARCEGNPELAITLISENVKFFPKSDWVYGIGIYDLANSYYALDMFREAYPHYLDVVQNTSFGKENRVLIDKYIESCLEHIDFNRYI